VVTDFAAIGVPSLRRPLVAGTALTPLVTGTAWTPHDVRRRFSKGVTCSMGGRLPGVCSNMLARAYNSRAVVQDSDMSQISCVQVFHARYESHAARQQRKAVLTVQRRAGKGGTLPSAVHEDHQRNGPQVGTVPWEKSGHAPAQAARHERTRTAKRDVPKALASGSVRLILLRPRTCPCIPRTRHRCALSAGGRGGMLSR